MSSTIIQITPKHQKETQPNAGSGRVERFSSNGGSIEVVYPPGWPSTQAATTPITLIEPAVPQTPKECSLEQLRAVIDEAAKTQDFPTAVEKMKEAVLPKAA